MKPSATSFHRYFPVSRRDKNWGLYATTAGEASIGLNTIYPPSGHPKGFAFDWQHGRILDGFALVYISSGRGRLNPNLISPLASNPAMLSSSFPESGIATRPTPELAGMNIG